MKIINVDKGLMNFTLYDYQKEMLKNFADNRFNIVLKSRQMGLSTVAAAYATWLAIFYKDKNVLVIATKLLVYILYIFTRKNSKKGILSFQHCLEF
jgi:hypothetical protein